MVLVLIIKMGNTYGRQKRRRGVFAMKAERARRLERGGGGALVLLGCRKRGGWGIVQQPGARQCATWTPHIPISCFTVAGALTGAKINRSSTVTRGPMGTMARMIIGF